MKLQALKMQNIMEAIQMNELLIPLDEKAVLFALKDANILVDMLDQIKCIATEDVFDMTDPASRKDCASVAAKVAKCKTFIDDKVGKSAVADMKAQCKVIDEKRKFARDSLDYLKAEIRQPLNEYEQIEKDRIAECERTLEEIKQGAVELHDNIETVKKSIERIEAIDTDSLAEYGPEALIAKSDTLIALDKKLADIQTRDSEKAELDKLRKQQLENEAKERERNAYEAATKKAEEDAADRVREAEEATKRAEQATEQARLKALSDAALAESAAEHRIEQAAQAERNKQAAKEKQEADEMALRLRNKEHMRKINNEALECLIRVKNVSENISEDMAKDIIAAIIKGEIKHININY